ncbi:MAG: zinc ribbon domain-containing protein [Gemmatimonadaceae bacterium]
MDAIERMFQVLVATIQAKHPNLLSAPFTVGDLHQQLLPYRHFRRELGLETNQEYELVLMQLLSGARGYLDVDDRLRDELGKELASSAPEPSRVRSFADAQVSINQAALATLGHAIPSPIPPPGGAKTATQAPSAADAGTCRYCSGALPKGRATHYCPHCGQNLQVHNCPACGAEREAGWKFCVACGKGMA